MDQDEKRIVIARIQRLSDGLRIAMITPEGNWSGGRAEMIEEIEKESKVGQGIVDMHMDFLRSFKDSEFWKPKGNRKSMLKTK